MRSGVRSPSAPPILSSTYSNKRRSLPFSCGQIVAKESGFDRWTLVLLSRPHVTLLRSHVRVTHQLRDGEGIKSRFTKPRSKRRSKIMPDQAFDSGQLTCFLKRVLDVFEPGTGFRTNKHVIPETLVTSQSQEYLAHFRVHWYLAILAYFCTRCDD